MILALEDPTPSESIGGRYSETNDFMYALGIFNDQVDNMPSFLLKVKIQSLADPDMIAGNKEEVSHHYVVYPNPVQSNLFFKGNEETDRINIAIYSTTGKIVYKSSSSIICPSFPLEVNVDALSSGIYMINFSTENKKLWTGKFVKK